MKFVVTSILVSFHVLFLKCCCGGWIDPDTPHDAKQITSLGTERTYVFTSIHLKWFLLFMLFIWLLVNGKAYDLVFSDEFNIPGRSFTDGTDPRWTAMNKNDYTNDALHYYKGMWMFEKGKGDQYLIFTSVQFYVKFSHSIQSFMVIFR